MPVVKLEIRMLLSPDDVGALLYLHARVPRRELVVELAEVEVTGLACGRIAPIVRLLEQALLLPLLQRGVRVVFLVVAGGAAMLPASASGEAVRRRDVVLLNRLLLVQDAVVRIAAVLVSVLLRMLLPGVCLDAESHGGLARGPVELI